MNVRVQFVVFLLLVAVALLMAVPMLAQEATPETEPPIVFEDGGTVIVEAEPAPNVPGEEEVGSLVEVLIAAVLASAFGTAPITTFIVSLLKPIFTGVSARGLTAIVALLLSIAMAAAVYFGFGTQFKNLLAVIAQVGPSIVTYIGTLIGAPLWYVLARWVNAPVVGNARTPEYNPRL